jgi:hypothetical protein
LNAVNPTASIIAFLASLALNLRRRPRGGLLPARIELALLPIPVGGVALGLLPWHLLWVWLAFLAGDVVARVVWALRRGRR